MSSDDLHFSAKAIDAIRRGRKVEAIKYVREDNGIGLREARDAVEAYAVGIQTLPHSAAPALPAEPPHSQASLAMIDRLLQEGEKLQVIQLLHKVTDMDLRQAKAWVDARLEGSAQTTDGAAPAAQTVRPASASAGPRHGPTVQRDTASDSWMWVVLVLLAVALVVWWFGG